MRQPRIAGYLKDALIRRGFRQLARERDATAFETFYSQIPFRYPRLFEQLCRSYSWAELELGEVELAANPAGPDLSGLAASLAHDRILWSFLVPRGYLIFGRMSGGRYDPCAFDMNRRRASDAPVVRVNHEEVLSFERVGRPVELASSFKAFLDDNLGPERGRRTSGCS
jgi:hypothetical protein